MNRNDTGVYEVSVRVKVCDPSAGLEPNCVAYPGGSYKPEGLIQQYSSVSATVSSATKISIPFWRMVESFALARSLLDLKPTIRAKEKANPNAEWDPQTGVFYPNPNPEDAAATTRQVGRTIASSGVINYLNRFGQMQTGKKTKIHDPVSELYYTAIRYFKKLGDVPEYSALTGSVNEKYQQADAFPVIRDWDDPIRYSCQSNVVLGIGDTNANRDKNLPGSTSNMEEPAKPQMVRDDKTVDVVKRMTQIFQMEGNNFSDATNLARASNFNTNSNSAYIAASAYDAHTGDMRPDLEGDQLLTTHWVDVVEAGSYKTPLTNQYWLTAKYGGFRVPAGYDPDKTLKPLPEERLVEQWRVCQ